MDTGPEAQDMHQELGNVTDVSHRFAIAPVPEDDTAAGCDLFEQDVDVATIAGSEHDGRPYDD